MASESRMSSDQEPLLGSPGGASQHDKPLRYNLVIGTGILAQLGVWVLTIIVWGSIFNQDLMLFSAHPLLNSAALFFFVQAILILQPTSTAAQKKQGAYAHAALINLGLLAGVTGLVVIEYNKFDHDGNHFESSHAILGLASYVLLLLQAIVGITQYFTPGLYGSAENAKSIYKYHRVSGYVTLLTMLATVCAATQTTFNIGVLQIQLWAVLVVSIMIVLGIAARIQLNKFGWLAGR